MNRISEKQTASMEDYLKAIFILQENGDKATVTVLSEAIGVKKSSVEWALNKLSVAGLVIHERYSDVKLTPEGSRVAEEVYRRHKALFRFLTDILKVNPVIAEQEACRMEHSLSRDSINRLEKFIKLVMKCHPGQPEWEEIFNSYVEQEIDEEEMQAWCAEGKIKKILPEKLV